MKVSSFHALKEGQHTADCRIQITLHTPDLFLTNGPLISQRRVLSNVTPITTIVAQFDSTRSARLPAVLLEARL